MRKIILIPENKQKLTYIVWQDAHSVSGWLSKQELVNRIENEACFIKEVGWVVYEDDKEIHMCARKVSWAKKAPYLPINYGLYQRIPKTWIIKRKVIKI